MKRAMAAIALVAALAVAGCGGSKVSPEQLHQAEAIVRPCLTKHTPRAIAACIAPPGHSAQLFSCAVTAGIHDFYSQPKLLAGLAACVVKYR